MVSSMEKARKIADKVGELPHIPSVILKAMSMLNDPKVSVKQINEQILLDQSLTVFVLKVANSALYGLRKEVSTVSYAINLMGYNVTRSILMAHLTKNLYTSKNNKLAQNILWKHSISSAVFSKKIAEAKKSVNLEEAFIAGLLHDIGKGVLLKNKSEVFGTIIDQILNQDTESVETEINELGYSHVEVGYLLMSKWGFSENIIETLIHHHSIQEYQGQNLLSPIVSLANKMSHNHDFSFKKANYDLFETAIVGLSETELETLVKVSLEEIDIFLQILA